MITYGSNEVLCNESLTYGYQTESGKEYLLFIAGENEFEKGPFTFELECDPESIVIPTISQWGLICLSLLLLIFGVVQMETKHTQSVLND